MKAERRIPTLADIEALPTNIKGQMIEGVRYTMTEPFVDVALHVARWWL